MTITTRSYPRAAVIGNPSDGYFGKTIAFVFDNFFAEVTLTKSATLEIIPNKRDKLHFKSLNDLTSRIDQFGYYGGIRLIKASLKKFATYCYQQNINLPSYNFSIAYHSTIPNRLGLAGSSAIITALMKAVFEFYNLKITAAHLANLVLSVETEELDIGAGLQDRVAQAFEQPLFMNFDNQIMARQSFGDYHTIPKQLFPPFFIAYQESLAEGSEVVHNNLRERFDQGDIEVLKAMKNFAALTEQALEDLKNNAGKNLGLLMNQNFDLRQSIISISDENQQLIDLARSIGASAKFTGSGGAIIGTYESEVQFQKLETIFNKNGIKIIKPNIVDQHVH